MKPLFHRRPGASGACAKKRITGILASERISCSPQLMDMLYNDIVNSVEKYVTIKEESMILRIYGIPPVLYFEVPVKQKKNFF